MDSVIVKYYSGHTYAERPVSFQWHGMDYKVEEIKKSWQAPGERHFKLRTTDNKLCQLCYNETEKQWLAIELLRS